MPKKKSKHNLIKRAEERNLIKLVNASRISDAETEIELVHKNGFIVLAIGESIGIKRFNWHQWSYKKEEIDNILLQNIIGYNHNTYLSLNSFKSPKKTISNLYSLNALWSDIDFYKIPKYADKTYEEMINTISKNKLIKKMPPSLWIYSGNGIYPLWLIKDAYAKACLPLWNKLMQEIHLELQQYGADSSAVEASHVLRLAGSNNSKTNCTSKIVKDIFDFNPKRYSLNELSELILPKFEYTKEEWNKIKSKKKKTKKERRACEIKSLFNIHTLNYNRMQDLFTLVEIRKGECDGYREIIIFLYRYWANCFHKNSETALAEAFELNSMFKNPLSKDEVIKATKSAENAAIIWEKKLNEYLSLEKKPSIASFFKNTGCYIYSNKKLIELLDITQEEMAFPLVTIINTKEKNRRNKDYRREYKRREHRNSNGLTYREQSKMDKIYTILELQKKGLNQSKIAERLGVSRQAVSKLIKEIKEKNITLKYTETLDVKQDIDLARITDTELNLMIL
ncbi:HTH domain-containing protein [Clostridium perfringens]